MSKKRRFDGYVQYPDVVVNPFIPHKAETKIILPEGVPTVVISDEAYNDMVTLVSIVGNEVGWLGRVSVRGNGAYHTIYCIEEIFLVDQVVSASHCEMTEQGISDLFMRLMCSDPEAVSEIRFWGHSHAYGTTYPSHQDDLQVARFSDNCEYFIRGICNKAGELRFDIYRFDIGVTFLDVAWCRSYVEKSERRWQLQQQVDKFVRTQSSVVKGTVGKIFSGLKDWSTAGGDMVGEQLPPYDTYSWPSNSTRTEDGK